MVLIGISAIAAGLIGAIAAQRATRTRIDRMNGRRWTIKRNESYWETRVKKQGL